MLLSVRILSKPSLALRLFSSLQEMSPNSILALNDPAKREAKGSVSPFEGGTTERGLRQPRRCSLRRSRAGRAGLERDRSGTGCQGTPHPLLPHLWPCLKFLQIPHHSGIGVKAIALSGGKKNHLYRNKISLSGRWVRFKVSCFDPPGCWQLRDHWCLLLQPRSANLCLCLQFER